MSDDTRAKAAAEEIYVTMGHELPYDTADYLVIDCLRQIVADAVAQAQEAVLESPLVAGCIKAVATLTQLGYGTNYETVVTAVAQAVKERDEEHKQNLSERAGPIIRLMEHLHKQAKENTRLKAKIAEQAEEIARLRAALEMICQTQPNNNPVVWAIVMTANKALDAPGQP